MKKYVFYWMTTFLGISLNDALCADKPLEVFRSTVMEMLLPTLSSPIYALDPSLYKDISREEFSFTNDSQNTLIAFSHQEVNVQKASWPVHHIVYLGGNGEAAENAYEWVENLMGAYPGYRFEVFSFNYRGVGGSSGRPNKFGDLCDDVVSFVSYLQSQKAVDPKRLLLFGWSLGGAVATCAAAKLHASDRPVKIISDRSIGSLTGLAHDFLRGMPFEIHPDNFIQAMDLNVDLADAYLKIAPASRMYLYVRFDPMIPEEFSLNTLLRKKGGSYQSGFELLDAGHASNTFVDFVKIGDRKELASEVIERFAFK